MVVFWHDMLAHWHGQVWNSSEFARSFGVADITVRWYLDILTSALVVRQLQPWHANIAKRQAKAPKVYLRDAGVLHALLGIDNMQSLNTHPKSGASWEGFLLDAIIDRFRLEDETRMRTLPSSRALCGAGSTTAASLPSTTRW